MSVSVFSCPSPLRGSPKNERLNQGTVPRKLALVHRTWNQLLMEPSATMFPIGNVALDSSNRLQRCCPSLRGRFCLQSVSRDRHDFNADRAVIFRSACQITGSTSSAAPSKTSVVTSVLPKNIESEDCLGAAGNMDQLSRLRDA